MKTCDKMKYLDNRKQILWESLPAKNMQVGLWNPRNLICRKVFLSHPPTAPFFFLKYQIQENFAVKWFSR